MIDYRAEIEKALLRIEAPPLIREKILALHDGSVLLAENAGFQRAADLALGLARKGGENAKAVACQG